MKVILVNGSPHKEGCTYTALREVQKVLEENEIKTEGMWLGTNAIAGCIGCNQCLKQNEEQKISNRCFIDDKVNEFIAKAKEADGFVFGTPVYYAHPSGRILSFLDRAFYSGGRFFAMITLFQA